MKWNLKGYRIDIGGSNGNVFVILAKISRFIQTYHGAEEANSFRALAIGQNMNKIGIEWTYDDVLDQCITLTGIQFVSTRELCAVDRRLYTLTSDFYL